MILLILGVISFIYAFTFKADEQYTIKKTMREHMIDCAIDFFIASWKELVVEAILISIIYYVWFK